MQKAIEDGYDYTLELSRDVMKLLSEIRTQWGMVYPFE